MTPLRSRFVRLRNGFRVHLLDGGAGPPVLMLHGFTGSAAAWPTSITAALAADHRLLVVDLPGHGRSDSSADPSRYALRNIVDDLVEVLDASSVERAIWIGYSMGGRVALGAARLAPDRVRGLVLESASPGIETDSDRAARREADEALARVVEERSVESFVDAWMAQPMFATRLRLPRATREAERARRLGNRADALAACLRGLGTGSQPSLWDALPGIAAPTLLVCGGEDVKFTGIGQAMADRLPDSRFHVVEAAGHAVHLEDPKGWLRVVQSFLGTVTSAVSPADRPSDP